MDYFETIEVNEFEGNAEGLDGLNGLQKGIEHNNFLLDGFVIKTSVFAEQNDIPCLFFHCLSIP